MPDPFVILQAMAAAACVAAAILWGTVAWKPPQHSGWWAIRWPLAIGAGFVVGAVGLGIRPRGLPGTDADRLLILVIPLVALVEIGLGFARSNSLVPWLVRLLVAAALAPVLLYGSVYLAKAGMGSSDTWTTPTRIVVLGGLAIAWVGQWFLTVTLAARGRGTTVWIAMALTGIGAGLATMLSGYMSAGQLALPMAAAFGMAAIASGLARTGQVASGGFVVGLTCLACLLIMGRFFGALTTLHAVMLATAPLLCWLPEIPWLATRSPWRRATMAAALVLLPVTIVVWMAQASFAAKSASPHGP